MAYFKFILSTRFVCLLCNVFNNSHKSLSTAGRSTRPAYIFCSHIFSFVLGLVAACNGYFLLIAFVLNYYVCLFYSHVLFDLLGFWLFYTYLNLIMSNCGIYLNSLLLCKTQLQFYIYLLYFIHLLDDGAFKLSYNYFVNVFIDSHG